MKENPKVSILTITYGHEKYIKQTLDGIFMQNYSGEIEFIIANDNSPDSTDDIIKNYLLIKKIPTNFTVKYTKHLLNKGMTSNFIWAMREATGKYIALCEGDDYWINPLKLKKQVNFLEENENYSFCTHRFEMLREGFDIDPPIVEPSKANNIPKYADRFYKDGDLVIDYNMFYRAWITQPLTSVFRNQYKNELINYAKKFKYFRDVHLFYFLLKKNNGYTFNSYMAVYRQHPAGEESGKSKYEKLLTKQEIWKELFKQFPLDGNLRVQYIESSLRLMQIVDKRRKFGIYKEIIKVSKGFYYFKKINYQFIKYFRSKRS